VSDGNLIFFKTVRNLTPGRRISRQITLRSEPRNFIHCETEEQSHG
jgi:hypothetical protein